MRSRLLVTGSRRGREGVSLIEVLGAVAILWLCFGLVFPLISSSRRSAVRKLAATEAIAVSQALQEYRETYGHWPGQTQGVHDVVYGVPDGSDAVPVWRALLDNPRRLVLLEVDEERWVDGRFRDPWERAYLLAMDENEDGRVDLHIEGLLETSVTARAVAMAYGEDTATIRVRSWSPAEQGE
jgi:type II secretory pathway pseudopilin PulG